ncbi:hydrogenase iron-sulfur subunit [Candidatus Thorarchaeota archaeon]|nr:MAG: hydrogenase iron-sulfur subunit [Candidatus Thorarchaeota archaeon]
MKKLILCTCNKTLTKWLDFSRIQKELGGTFEKVQVHDSLCLEEGLTFLDTEVSKDDTVVIGACTSQIIGVPFAKRLKSELVSYVPLREHVAWVHKDDQKGATNKALVLLHDAAIHVSFLEPQTTVETQMEKKVLIVGGDIAGLKVASDLLQLGIEVTLLEPPEFKSENYVEKSQFMAENSVLKTAVKDLTSSSKGAKKICGSITKISGRAGLYFVTLKHESGKEEEILVGSIVVATNAEHSPPSMAKMYHYGKSNETILISDLSELIAKQTAKDSKTIFVAQDPSYHDSSVAGSYLLREVTKAAEKGNTVIVAHSDIYTKDENLYRTARKTGVIFVRGALEKVEITKKGLVCRLENTLESQVREFTVDYLVLQTQLKPWSGTRRLSDTLGLTLDEHGFIKTRYAKMKPVQTSKRGIFIAGNAKTPMNLNDALASASNASLEVFKNLIADNERKGWIPVVNEELCDLCEACVIACPNDALRHEGDLIKHIPMNCEFCGICVSACPTRAIEFQSHNKDSWLTRIDAIAKNHKKLEGLKPFSLVYACSECANASIDQAGFAGKGYPTGSYVIQFPCAGMVSPIEILKGLVVGAEQIVVAHCPPGGCHHQTGDHLSELVVKFTQDMLKTIGQDPGRVKATYMIAALPNKMQEEVAHRG